MPKKGKAIPAYISFFNRDKLLLKIKDCSEDRITPGEVELLLAEKGIIGCTEYVVEIEDVEFRVKFLTKELVNVSVKTCKDSNEVDSSWNSFYYKRKKIKRQYEIIQEKICG